MFKNLDVLRNLVEKISNEDEEGDVSSFISDIEAFRSAQKGGAVSVSNEGIDESIMRVLSEYEEQG